jgi:hypothetical protein
VAPDAPVPPVTADAPVPPVATGLRTSEAGNVDTLADHYGGARLQNHYKRSRKVNRA